MLKALESGALYESIQKFHFEKINPVIERYHGRIPLAMWMLFQLKCSFQIPRKKPPSYAQFIINSLKAESQRVQTRAIGSSVDGGNIADLESEGVVENMTDSSEALGLFSKEELHCGHYLKDYIAWDLKTSEVHVIDQRVSHLKEYLQSFLTGYALPPIDYFENIYE